jgi:hypothetical protein
MNADVRGYWRRNIRSFENHLFTLIDTGICGLQKTLLAVVADQEALPQRFLAQPDGLHGHGRVLR